MLWCESDHVNLTKKSADQGGGWELRINFTAIINQTGDVEVKAMFNGMRKKMDLLLGQTVIF